MRYLILFALLVSIPVNAFALVQYDCLTTDGSNPGNAYSNCWSSLAAFVAGAQADLTGVTNELRLEIIGDWQNVPDMTVTTINGFTMDDTHFLNITAPTVADMTGVTNSTRHSGVSTQGKYRLSVNGATVMSIRDSHVRLDGFQIQGARSGSNQLRGLLITGIPGTNDIRVSNMIIAATTTTTANVEGISIDDNEVTVTLWNTIIDGWDSTDNESAGIKVMDGTLIAYNTTVANQPNASGVSVNPAASLSGVTNAIVFNNEVDFAAASADLGVFYSVSDDGDGTNPQQFTGEAAQWAVNFTDYVNGDFSLLSGASAYNNGIDDPGSGLFSDDIAGFTRTVTWDIGAFEFDDSAPAGAARPPTQILGPIISWLKQKFLKVEE